MSNPVRRIVAVLLVLVYIGLGFFREFLFLNINEQMRVTYYNSPDSHLSPALSFLENYGYNALYYSKWPLTLVFAALFCMLAVFVIRIGFATRQYTRLIVLAYAAVFGLGALVLLIGWLFNINEAVYDLSRFLAGLVESPVLLLMIGGGILYARK
ncbi:MAG: hypothetical protein MUC87_14215 [Bacteroidia bacterium]|jgi:hypothetical protein|nr:hypothetical protein [Bacteroidia bacterium]